MSEPLRREWNKSQKKEKKSLRREILMFRNSFKLNLFSNMFRNLLSVTYKNLEIHCISTFPKYKDIKKTASQSHLFWRKRTAPKIYFNWLHSSACWFWAGRSLFIKFCAGMRKGLIFPFFMSNACNEELTRTHWSLFLTILNWNFRFWRRLNISFWS